MAICPMHFQIFYTLWFGHLAYL